MIAVWAWPFLQESMEVLNEVSSQCIYCKCIHIVQNEISKGDKKKYSHINFHRDVALSLIAGFTSRKRKPDPPMYMGPLMPANEGGH